MPVLNLGSATLDLANIPRGDDVTVTLTTTTTTWLDGETLTATVYSTAGTAVTTFTTAWSAGTLTLTLSDTQTAALTSSLYRWNLVGVEGGVTTTHLAGKLTVVPQSTPGGSTTVSGTVTVTTSSVALSITDNALGTIQAHLDDTTDAHDASAISVLDTAGYYAATDVESALAEQATKFSSWARAQKAAALLARFQRTQPTTVYAGTATVVVSVNGAASTITSAIRIPLSRLSATYYNSANDPAWLCAGVPAGALAVTNSDVSLPDYLTGGSSQVARWIPRFGAVYTGQKIGFYIRSKATTTNYRIWVNGLPLTATMNTATTLNPGRHHIEVDFGSSDTRIVEFEVDGNTAEFGGAYIETTAVLHAAPRRPRITALADSISNGHDGWPVWTAQHFNAERWSNSIGGTGYLTTTGGLNNLFSDRVADVLACSADIIFVFGGQNDSGNAKATIQAAAESLFSTLKTQNPKSILIAMGTWMTSEIVTTAVKDTDDAIKAAAAAQSIPFISLIDPFNLNATTNAWATATSYAVGDLVVSSNVVWVCQIAHTSAASIDKTKFAALSFITGVGKVGSTTGRGNADVYIQADGIHPTVPCAKDLGSFIAAHTVRRLTELVAAG